ncbi:MAG TPA: NAD(P)(+) transhydrogenase (Re/Si-specific) subunit beta, partial [Bacteroidetes bacterium]|nr:NAD(P)(+) transhydrogenase (Re/Si-specific) subunit beta [Bacteroidota bacterium]HEX05023.1 NAD(P)(+) transhydrogenase (Re/Si-specific) subunit beta [Bacteroidota bacterium]
VAAAELVKYFKMGPPSGINLTQMAVATVLAGLIGSVTFFGSYIAFGKLAEFLAVKWKLHAWQKAVKFGSALLFVVLGAYIAWSSGFSIYSDLSLIFLLLTALMTLGKKAVFPGIQMVKLVSAIATVAVGVMLVLQVMGTMSFTDQPMDLFWLLVSISALLGVTLTFSIGGADMPVVIALLNSYSGIAAAMTGFVINNTVLIIAGSLVGASGIILTNIMCVAMNRSLANVLFGAMGSTVQDVDVDEIYKSVKSTSADEIAMMLEMAQKVLIVPGYGMAVSQAQHTVRDLANLLESKWNIEVVYGVHPVAGRMPGHMNVLLAEANIPYDKLLEMDDVNSMMDSIDVCIVIGANDVVNPVARTEGSPISGMPIIDVDKARTVIVIKRSLSPGFAGIPNPLFAAENAMMFFNDGKKAFTEIITAVKES